MQVHEDGVGMQPVDHCDGVAPVASFADHGEGAIRLDRGAREPTLNRRVVHDHDRQRHATGHLGGGRRNHGHGHLGRTVGWARWGCRGPTRALIEVSS